MYRIFIVEDNEPTRTRLIEEIQEAIHDADVTAAATVEEAEAKIGQTGDEELPFDVAILDSQLPRAGILEINTTLCEAVSRRMPSTFVIHFTAFGEDQVFRRHMGSVHPRSSFVRKEGHWDQEVIGKLVRNKVERQLEDVFLRGASTPAGRFRQGGGTFRLAALMSDIERYWNLLPEDTKHLVRRDFDVVEDGETVTVSLGGAR